MLIKIPNFTGFVPRMPAQLLPDSGAAYAKDCNFANHQLSPIKGDGGAHLLPSGTQEFYSTNGVEFLSFTHHWADPSPSPISDDEYNRLYFLDEDGNVSVTSEDHAQVGGTAELTQWHAGVPQPGDFTIIRTAKPDNRPDNVAGFAFTAYWELGGNRYQEGDIDVVYQTGADQNLKFTVTMPQKKYQVGYSTKGDPAPPVSLKWNTPARAVPVVKIEALDEHGEVAFTVYANSSQRPDTSNGVLGGVTVDTEIKSSATVEDSGVILPDSADDKDDATSAVVNAELELTLSYGQVSATAYVWTGVNTWGEEGPPTDPVIVRPTAIEDATISVPPRSYGRYKEVTKLRLYRTSTGSTGTAFFFVDEVDSNESTYIDEFKDDELGEELPSENWYPPPVIENSTERLALKLMPNGMFAYVRHDTIYFSQPYLPHAYNPLDSISLAHPIVACEVGDAGLVCITTEGCMLVSGVSPDSMTQYRLPVNQTCLGPKAITRLGSGVVYASNDGVVFVQGTQAGIAPSQKFYTRREWSSFIHNRESRLQLDSHDGFLYVYFDGNHANESNHGLRINLDDDGSLSEFSGTYECSGTVPQTDGLYFFKAGQLYRYGSSDAWASKDNSSVQFQWRSKDFVLPYPVSLGAFEIDCQSENGIAVKIYADDSEVWQSTVHDYDILNLPSGFRARKWAVELSGAGVVRNLALAGSRMELMNVS